MATASQPNLSDDSIQTADGGRLCVACRFLPLLRAAEACSFEALWNLSAGREVRRVPGRSTTTFCLPGPAGPCQLFLKRFDAAPWRERLLPWLQGKPSIWGARHEWNAIVRFRALGLPTVTPVAVGQWGARSLLLTEALPRAQSLLEWVAQNAPPAPGGDAGSSTHATLAALIVEVAQLARAMHRQGWHHQDFYLNHLLLCGEKPDQRVHVIDLGRATYRPRLARRWIIKDLAQLNYSARGLPCTQRLRFLREYLGRRLQAADRPLVRRIVVKSHHIARHTRKHGL